MVSLFLQRGVEMQLGAKARVVAACLARRDTPLLNRLFAQLFVYRDGKVASTPDGMSGRTFFKKNLLFLHMWGGWCGLP